MTLHRDPVPAGTPAVSFALDTDIGTDVDDLLALTMILGSPELDVPLVTTVYGDVDLRARIVSKVFALSGRSAPRIVPGRRETLSGRDVWWPGHEGSTIADLHVQTFTEGADAIAELAASRIVAAIGPLTDAALAVSSDESIVEELVLMGGEFVTGIVEHNIRCDVTAAQRVFSSGVRTTAVGLEQTERIRLDRDDLAAIAASGPLGALVAAEMQRFWEFAEQDYNVPHDPLAVLTFAEPELFETRAGVVSVADDGRTTFAPAAGGPHLIVSDLDEAAVKDQILRRIHAGLETASGASH